MTNEDIDNIIWFLGELNNNKLLKLTDAVTVHLDRDGHRIVGGNGFDHGLGMLSLMSNLARIVAHQTSAHSHRDDLSNSREIEI